jgi:antirestriction protein ArdC
MHMNTYEISTEKIISLLEAGTIPWQRPWSAVGMPRNLVSLRPYRGINVWLLSASKYVSPLWLTFRQANELGGHVRQGEHGQMVVFWKIDRMANDTDIEPDAENFTAQEARRRFVLRYFRVWNLQQCELPTAVHDRVPKIETHQHDPIEAAERIVREMPKAPVIQYGGSQAFYSPITDRITLPPRELFASTEDIYACLFHELSHATGSPKRLNRQSIAEAAPFGSPSYAAEELVAEMGAAYLCAEARISRAVVENQAAYISGWLEKLRKDKRLVVLAAAQAQKAADYILSAGGCDQGS